MVIVRCHRRGEKVGYYVESESKTFGPYKREATALRRKYRILGAKPGQRAYTCSDISRLAFCNSKRLPQTISIEGRRRQWVGIGWIDEGAADGTEEAIIVD